MKVIRHEMLYLSLVAILRRNTDHSVVLLALELPRHAGPGSESVASGRPIGNPLRYGFVDGVRPAPHGVLEVHHAEMRAYDLKGDLGLLTLQRVMGGIPHR